jgi:hypothetical protein
VLEKVKEERKGYKKEEERHRLLYSMLDKQFPGWEKYYLRLLGFTGPGALTKEARKKIEDMREQMNTLPDYDND